jgi:transaldolase/glucose-6-phosphate isomerase
VENAKRRRAILRSDYLRVISKAGDYFALLAHREEDRSECPSIRHWCAKSAWRPAWFGPRFLHSTGQAYKGGPNISVFLQITYSDAFDVPVPGEKYTFGVVKAAQARGISVLVDRQCRAPRITSARISWRA